MLIVCLDLLKLVGKNKNIPQIKWWFNGDAPWYKVNNHLKQIKVCFMGILATPPKATPPKK